MADAMLSWRLANGEIVTGKIVRENGLTVTMLRSDGTTCHVPKSELIPAKLPVKR